MTIATRIARLEQHRQPKGGYIVRVSQPTTSDEMASIMRAKAEGRRHAILPHRCNTAEEWLASYGREAPQ